MTANPIFKKYRYDISLEDGKGATLVFWLSALMVFFMALSLAVTFALSSLTNNWIDALNGKMTIEIPAPEEKPGQKSDAARFESLTAETLAIVKRQNFIAEAQVLSSAEVRSLVQPWLGSDIDANIPLPALIDVTLAEGADAQTIKDSLSRIIDPSVRIDIHDETMNSMRGIVRTVQVFFFLLTAVILTLSAAAIAAMVRAKIAIHKDEVETLHLLGAAAPYICRQFRQHTLRGTLKGALCGAVFTALILASVAVVTNTLDTTFWPQLKLMPMQWITLSLTPILFACIISHFTAQRTALSVMRQLP